MTPQLILHYNGLVAFEVHIAKKKFLGEFSENALCRACVAVFAHEAMMSDSPHVVLLQLLVAASLSVQAWPALLH